MAKKMISNFHREDFRRLTCTHSFFTRSSNLSGNSGDVIVSVENEPNICNRGSFSAGWVWSDWFEFEREARGRVWRKFDLSGANRPKIGGAREPPAKITQHQGPNFHEFTPKPPNIFSRLIIASYVSETPHMFKKSRLQR